MEDLLILNVIIAEQAVNSMLYINDFIAEDNPNAAEKTVKKIFDSFTLLAKNPQIGKKLQLKKSKQNDYFYWIVSPYIVIYSYNEKNLDILNVVDGRSNYTKKLDLK